ncbi:transporter substrate-binding domain-containing protein [Romeria aff. gracilis LEGE 07310]|uniref:Transporter substrate-binding domain-containing protein n=1 Tax=Vasconcelosia minhoensis LEGE 07310 TaxID=915328 RepID=A0A8J7DPC4_9CYAN|nr:transporter substrate-binding domain-containing protein [Romeria gracilis]MBE9079460.1 transporter substrate-binding domain-containing protein [Romeria aff. gracilis LEGE 07310]
MRRLFTLLSVGSAALLAGGLLRPVPAGAQSTQPNDPTQAQTSPQPQAKMTIGVSPMPPFAIQTQTESGNDWDGIGVHLWREIAEELNIQYEWQELQPGEEVERVQDGTVDMAITATATADAEQQVDFTQSYYISSLGIAQSRQRGFLDVATSVLSPGFLWVCLWLSLLLVAVGAIVWLFERSKNEEMFNAHPGRGIWDSFWWAGVTMTTIGYGDKAPVTVGGRVIALIWMLIAMGITASLTATITSVLTQDRTSQLTQFADLKAIKVGSIEGSSAAEALEQQQISFQSVKAPLDGLRAVDQGQLDAFVYDAALLNYLNRNELKSRLYIESTGLQIRRYVITMPEDSPRLETISSQVMREQSQADWQAMLKRFLPQSE